MDVTAGSSQRTREQSRTATRARLVESARSLFADSGVHGVTTHDIARQAGVAAGTFYLYFKDKQHIFREIVYSAVERLRERLDSAIDDAPDVPSAIRRHAEALVDFAAENRDLVRIVFSRDHGAARMESDVLDRLAASGANALRERVKTGSFRGSLDVEVAAQALTGMFARVVAWWIENPQRVARETVVETLVQMQLAGTVAEPRDTRS